jgi:hypothetical protein
MVNSTSLLDWIMDLFRDPEARAAFQEDPQGYAADHGFQDLSANDVYDSLCLIADSQSSGYDYKGGGEESVHYPPPHHPDASGEETTTSQTITRSSRKTKRTSTTRCTKISTLTVVTSVK